MLAIIQGLYNFVMNKKEVLNDSWTAMGVGLTLCCRCVSGLVALGQVKVPFAP